MNRRSKARRIKDTEKQMGEIMEGTV